MTRARVLIVEDESIVRMHVRATVEAIGHEVVASVATAEEAVEAARREAPDLILMDIQLRGERTGVDAARELSLDVDAALIFVTAFADENTVRATESVGAVGYIVKPFSEPELRAVITTALGTHRRARRLRARERTLARVLFGGSDAIVVADTEARVTFANRGACDATGWAPADVIGLPLEEALRVDPSERVAFEAAVSRVMGGSEAAPFQIRVKMQSRTAELSGELTPLFPEIPSDAGLVATFRSGQAGFQLASPRDDTGARLLIYSHDTFGLGHLSRSVNLASALIQHFPQLSVLIVTGSSVAHRMRMPARVDYVKLPAVRKVASERYQARSLAMSDATIVEFRASLLLRTVQDFDPDAVLVDHSPAGMKGELVPSLEWLAANRPGCARMLGLRDVIDDPESVLSIWTKDGLYRLVEDSYDHVFVYGMREVFDAASAYRFSPALASRVAYMNYVGETAELPPSAGNRTEGKQRRRVLVTIGGGDGAGELVVGTFLEMAERLGGAMEFDATIVTGPLVDEELLRSFQTRAAALPSVSLVEFVDSTSAPMRGADLVICTGGYNTTAQAMRHARSVVIIPRITHRKEQLVRAECLRARGMAGLIHPDELTADLLAATIRRELAAGPDAQMKARALLQFDGAENVARYCAEHGVIRGRSELRT
ncbi:MAG: response regulator [Candidatus Krumholzibacteria bacterium]|nr:response regulator [Candidatus Krumholzibacteria bacterium]MDH4337698.1 response regulator [Candidatus Krumholzibacteria bacterium]MDH5269863.1 response regulator [Candidatus Krumholzibacteria bacterium]